MKQAPRTRPWARAAAVLCASALSACNSGGADTAAVAGGGAQATALAYGTAPLGAALVTIADASSPTRQLQATTSASGSFTVDVSGLTAPYLLQVVSGAQALYAVAEDATNLDVNPITDAAFAFAAGDAGSAALFQAAGTARNAQAAVQARALLTDLAAQATPLLARFGIANLRTDQAAVRLLLQDIAVTRANGVVTLTNKSSGSVIQTMPMGGSQGGAFDPCQLPPGPPPGSSGGASSGGSATSSGGIPPAPSSSSSGASSCSLPSNHPSISNGTSCSTCHGSKYSACTALATTAVAVSNGNTTNLPANHPSIPAGATCTSCHGGGPSGGSSSGGLSSGGAPSSGGFPPAPPTSSGGFPPAPPTSSGGFPPAPPTSSGGATSSGGLPPAPPTSSGGSSSSGASSGGLPPAPPSSGGLSSGGMPSSGGMSSSGAAITCTSSSGGSSSGGTASIDGVTIYAAKCAICHGALGSSNKQGATAAHILARHPNYVTSAEATAIASALSGSTSPGGTSSSSGGTSTSSGSASLPSTGSACGYGSNTAALAVTSGSRSLSAGTYTATGQNESGVCVANSGSTLTLTNPVITTSGNTSSTDSSSFYGQNAGALAYTGGTLALTGGMISTTGTGANGVFAYGTGKATVTGTTIDAKAEGGHGLMTAGGGTLVAKDVVATTWGQNGSVIATDRGTGNKVTVTGGTFIGHGYHSAGVYSTGEITVSGAVLTSEAAEGVVIEGKNSVILNDCTVTSASSDKRGMFVYQSFSGDASVGQGVLTMNGGSYTFDTSDATGAAFYSTNTTASITLDGVRVTNPTGYLLQAGANQWGTSGSNGAAVTFSARNETLRGDIVADAISSVAASFSSSSYTGAVNAANTAKAMSVALDATSLWTATATSYVHTLTGVALSGSTVSNIAGSASANVCYRSGFTDASGATHTSGTYALRNGGSLLKC